MDRGFHWDRLNKARLMDKNWKGYDKWQHLPLELSIDSIPTRNQNNTIKALKIISIQEGIPIPRMPRKTRAEATRVITTLYRNLRSVPDVRERRDALIKQFGR